MVMNRRRTFTLSVAAAALAAASALPVASAQATTTAGDIPSAPTTGPCAYRPTPEQAETSKFVGLPKDPNPTPNTGSVSLVMKTSYGDIPLTLNRQLAECTVQSMVHLVEQRLFNSTICHRITQYTSLSVLQCGDPKGTGSGGPGYSFKDELPTHLKPWRGHAQARLYPRGTLAMANAGPNTNGSQFFMVYKDSGLMPNYTVFGQVEPAGLTVLDAIAAAGIQGGGNDGTPNRPVQVESVTLAAR